MGVPDGYDTGHHAELHRVTVSHLKPKHSRAHWHLLHLFVLVLPTSHVLVWPWFRVGFISGNLCLIAFVILLLVLLHVFFTSGYFWNCSPSRATRRSLPPIITLGCKLPRTQPLNRQLCVLRLLAAVLGRFLCVLLRLNR